MNEKLAVIENVENLTKEALEELSNGKGENVENLSKEALEEHGNGKGENDHEQ